MKRIKNLCASVGLSVFCLSLTGCPLWFPEPEASPDEDVQNALFAFAVLSSIFELEGSWPDLGFCSAGTCNSGFVSLTVTRQPQYIEWTDASPFTYHIFAFNNISNVIYFQQISFPAFPTNNGKFGAIHYVGPTTDCQNGKSLCFYYCETVSGQSSLEEAISADRSAGYSTTTVSQASQNGSCGAFSHSVAYAN